MKFGLANEELDINDPIGCPDTANYRDCISIFNENVRHNIPSDTSARAVMMTGRILDFVTNQTLQAKNSWIGVEIATFEHVVSSATRLQVRLTIVMGSKSRKQLVNDRL